MDVPPKKLLVTGDRVLIAPEEGEERTKVGLYLPATAIDTQQVQEGLIIATGPGDPIPDPSVFEEGDSPPCPGRLDPEDPHPTGRVYPRLARCQDHNLQFITYI